MAKRIPLGRGKFALVDDTDFGFLSQWKWNYTSGYASRGEYPPGMKGIRIVILMHRHLVGCPEKLQVDHINGDPLDNRKSNLRIATASNNQWNKKLQVNNVSGHKGVTWDKANQKWRASVNMHTKYINLGRFDTIDEAVAVRSKYIQEIHGEFARQS